MEIKISVEELRKRKLMVCTPCYGGMNATMYTKSMSDLSSMCVKYGIQLQQYYLSNESLIPRGRAYCCDEFLRSDCTHMIFIDSDIGFDAKDVISLLALQSDESEYDVIGAVYPKKCLPSSVRIETENGIKTISQLVKENYTGKVLSMDNKGNIVWNKVTRHWSQKNNGKKWVGLQTSDVRSRNTIVSTDDHEIAYITDLVNPEIKYCDAKHMTGKYIVRKSKTASLNNKNNIQPLYNKEQLSVLIGAVLGDGCMTKGKYCCTHGIKQHDYLKYKADILGGNVKITSDGLSTTHEFTNAQTKYFSKLLYENGRKTLKNVLHLFDETSLAIMYMDDGNRRQVNEEPSEVITEKSWWTDGDTCVRCIDKPVGDWKRGRKLITGRPTATIATHALSKDDSEMLLLHIKDKFDIAGKTHKQGGGKYHQLWFDADNTVKLYKLIAPYVPESMHYKICPEYWLYPKKKINNKFLDFAATEVKNVVDFYDKNNSKLYDIEVENTHCFFANDTLVHNCISWEKVKAASDKGLGNENPNDLERYIGDFVFNPKAGVSSFRVDQPVEVMELGTGFMMIRRKTFEIYKEKTPTLSYRPDHVRTTNFDGSREIHMYFDCAIDRGYSFQEMHDLVTEVSTSTDVADLGKLNQKAKEMLAKETTASKRYLSEDYKFCQDVSNFGMKIWLCPWIKLSHVGTYVFSGGLADMAVAGTAATASFEELQKAKDSDKAKQKFTDRISKPKQ